MMCAAILLPPRGEGSRSSRQAERRSLSPRGRPKSSGSPSRRDRRRRIVDGRMDGYIDGHSSEEEDELDPDDTTPPSRGSDLSGRGGRTSRRSRFGPNNESHSAQNYHYSLHGNPNVAGIRVAAMDGGLGLWFLFTVRAIAMSLC